MLKTYILLNILTLLILANVKNISKLQKFNYFILWVVAFEVVISELLKYFTKTNQTAYGIFAITCSVYYILVFVFYFQVNKFKLLQLGAFLLLLNLTLVYFYYKNLFVLLSKIYLINYTIACILSLKFFWTKIQLAGIQEKLYSDPMLYFSAGLLIFYTSSFPLLLFLETLISSGNLLRTYSSFLNFSNIFLSLGYLGAAICIRKTPPSTTSS